MGLPKLNYDPGSGALDLLFARGPQAFRCFYQSRVHDNLATSGVKERVVEAHDMLITFTMPALKISDDLPAWTAFQKFALGGGQFTLYINTGDLSHFYHCVSDDQGFATDWVGPGVYKAAFQWRIVIDGDAPADPSVVMAKFYGL